LIAFPNCKINLGLWITGRLPDGYHTIETLMFPVACTDALEIIPATDTTLTVTGNMLPEVAMEKNLCYKAWLALHNQYRIPPVSMHLHKVIPAGAGLGGGSADAVFTLKILNVLFDLKLKYSELYALALQLGMDCPFFLENTPVLATGKGEILTKIDLQLSGYHLLVVKPDVFVSTAEAYSNVTPATREVKLSEIIQMPINEWHTMLKNDFEKSVFPKYPIIGSIKEQLYKSGAVYASMSGSGSAVFGLFDERPDPKIFDKYFTFSVLLGG
jgi:4-diphosphocytidyl-2-C-methyl-D-erythritol kinase